MDRDEPPDPTMREATLRRAQSAGAPRICLLLFGEETPRAVPLEIGVPVVIGRAKSADVRVDDPSISREHLRVTARDDGAEVEDLGSSHGSKLDGVPLEQPTLALPGSTLRLGAISVAVHRSSERAGLVLGVDSYARFVERLRQEVARSREGSRSVAVIMLRARGTEERDHVSAWVPRLRERLRPVDCVALEGPHGALVLVVETTPAAAEATARELIEGGPLVAGVAAQRAGAGALIDAARTLAERASPDTPVLATGEATPVTGEPIFLSAASVALADLIERAAQTNAAALVLGETGSGKEVVARALHERGPRAAGPFRAVNCGAIPETLIEATFLGHERGAFSGASQRAPGLFEQADGGTLFLDELGELSHAAQAALLRAVETGSVTRLGGRAEVRFDARIVAATHRDLQGLVEVGSFRQDLLYRLNSLVLRVPPLRERPEDLEALIDRILADAPHRDGAARDLDPDARAALRGYGWPGNVRELRNVLARALVLATGPSVSLADLPAPVRTRSSAPVSEPSSPRPTPKADAPADPDFGDRVKAYEIGLIRDALAKAGGNRTEAARQLRMPVRTLYNKIKAYGLSDDPS